MRSAREANACCQAANTSQYAEAMPAGDRRQVANARAKGTFCYMATAPVNYFALRNVLEIFAASSGARAPKRYRFFALARLA